MIPTNNTVPYKATPIVTYAIMAICALTFLYEMILSQAQLMNFLNDNALVPARYTNYSWAEKNGLWQSDLTPFVTSMFLHGGLLHIASNLWTFWIFGPALEDRLGPKKFALLYLLAGLAAGVAHFVFNFSSTAPALGASGAIAGIIAAYVRRFPYAWINILQPIGLMPIFLFMPAIIFAGLWFMAQIASGMGSMFLPGQGDGVAWWAHVGGFIAGWLLIKKLADPINPAEEQQSATRSFFWPLENWYRWMTWWWRRGR